MCSQLLLVAEADLAFRTLVWAGVPFHLQALFTLLTQWYLSLRLLFSGAVQFSTRGRVSTALNRLRVRVPRAWFQKGRISWTIPEHSLLHAKESLLFSSTGKHAGQTCRVLLFNHGPICCKEKDKQKIIFQYFWCVQNQMLGDFRRLKTKLLRMIELGQSGGGSEHLTLRQQCYYSSPNLSISWCLNSMKNDKIHCDHLIQKC